MRASLQALEKVLRDALRLASGEQQSVIQQALDGVCDLSCADSDQPKVAKQPLEDVARGGTSEDCLNRQCMLQIGEHVWPALEKAVLAYLIKIS